MAYHVLKLCERSAFRFSALRAGIKFEVALSYRTSLYFIRGKRGLNLTFPSKRRNILAISVAILKAARRGIRETRLLSTVCLSYEQSKRYIEFLKAQGFIEENGNVYQTTTEGLELIEEVDSSFWIRGFFA